MTIYLSDYQTFQSTQELNHHVRQHEKAYTYELTGSQRAVLRFIARYSVKYAGASHLKTSTIAEGTDKSERTVRRIIKALEGYGVIKRVATIRPKSGGSGANIIVILPFVAPRLSDRSNADKPHQATSEPDNRRNEPLHKRDRPNYVLDTRVPLESAVKNCIPTPIYDALAPFYNAKEMQRLTGVILRAKASVHRDIRIEDHTEAFKVTVFDCIRRVKSGSIRKLDGYLHTAMKRLFRRLSIVEAFDW
ncbi:helix-turn-helix domain-containing protein [Bacillus sp. SCS-153A]|uniref:helix-turn-helix domain-containing protein n=1 Tax=Rossellomorea sedimentorum TaxID=3115294 RepID=UPI003906B2B9